MVGIKVGSNVRGLNDRIKWKKLFKFIRMKRFNIFMAQEIYADYKNSLMWEKEWGDKVFLAMGSSN